MPIHTWVLRLPSNGEATPTHGVIGSEPEIERVMGAVELRRVVLTTELAETVRRGTVTIMNLKKVIIAVCAALQMKVGKGNSESLRRKYKMSHIHLTAYFRPTKHCDLTFC